MPSSMDHSFAGDDRDLGPFLALMVEQGASDLFLEAYEVFHNQREQQRKQSLALLPIAHSQMLWTQDRLLNPSDRKSVV